MPVINRNRIAETVHVSITVGKTIADHCRAAAYLMQPILKVLLPEKIIYGIESMIIAQHQHLLNIMSQTGIWCAKHQALWVQLCAAYAIYAQRIEHVDPVFSQIIYFLQCERTGR